MYTFNLHYLRERPLQIKPELKKCVFSWQIPPKNIFFKIMLSFPAAAVIGKVVWHSRRPCTPIQSFMSGYAARGTVPSRFSNSTLGLILVSMSPKVILKSNILKLCEKLLKDVAKPPKMADLGSRYQASARFLCGNLYNCLHGGILIYIK